MRNDLLDDDGHLKRTGTIWTASAHIITAVIGSGVLSLAWPVAQLGWIAGPAAMLMFGLVITYTSSLLADCYRTGDPLVGKRNHTYMDVVRSSLGCSQSPLVGAVSLCNPFNLVIADEDFCKGFNKVYDQSLANGRCKIFKKHALLFEDMEGEYNISSATNPKSIRDFDQGLTRVSFGFKSVDDYYSNSSISDSIKFVCIPLLCIQSK